MSREVKRYEHFGDYCGPQCGIEESERGCWVRSEDYEALLAENERLRMQLVACGVVALANTPESAAEARVMHPDYMSASCQDVMRAVDSEIALRAERDALKKDADRYLWIKECDPEEIDIVIENPGDDLDAAIDAALQGEQP